MQLLSVMVMLRHSFGHATSKLWSCQIIVKVMPRNRYGHATSIFSVQQSQRDTSSFSFLIFSFSQFRKV